MQRNIAKNDIRVLGYVLRRTNYSEADRIINLITPMGKISAIAKGVRKEKSKLAGGIEMFTLSDYNIHCGKSELGVITSVRMVKHFGEIIKDLSKLEIAGNFLRQVNKYAEGSDSPDFFQIIDQCFNGLNDGANVEVIEGWFWLNLVKAHGGEINLYRDVHGEKLSADFNYNWDLGEEGFVQAEGGEYGANEIKMLRLMYVSELNVVKRIKADGDLVAKVLKLARIAAKV